MAKQTILDRISVLVAADFDALLDHSEAPSAALDQLVRDYTTCIVDVEAALEETANSFPISDSPAATAAPSDAGSSPAGPSPGEYVGQLKSGLDGMRAKLSELTEKRDEIAALATAAPNPGSQPRRDLFTASEGQ